MATSLSAVVTKPHESVELRAVQIPDLEPGGMPGKVEAATLCGTDVHIWEGGMGARNLHPYIPGHETAMIIEEMNGPRTDLLGKPLAIGDRVLCAYPRCG